MASRVQWAPTTVGFFLQYIEEEKNSGENWAGKSPTPKGYANIAEKLRRRTDLVYNKAHMKNKFESLRTTYHLYHNMFSGQTGVGYNFAMGIITMPDAWWEEKIAENIQYRKFRRNGLEHAELMYNVFRGNSATGEYNYTPTAFAPLGNPSGHDETSGAETPPSTPPTTPRLAEDITSPPREIPGTSRFSGTKRKSSDDMSWKTTMDSMNAKFADAAAENEYTVNVVKKDENSDQFSKAMNLLFSTPGVVPGGRLFKLGLKMIEDYNKRNVWVRLVDDEQRLVYLNMQDE